MPGDLGFNLISIATTTLTVLIIGTLMQLIKLELQYALWMIKEIQNVTELKRSLFQKILNTLLLLGTN